jgi:hypothetical protein
MNLYVAFLDVNETAYIKTNLHCTWILTSLLVIFDILFVASQIIRVSLSHRNGLKSMLLWDIIMRLSSSEILYTAVCVKSVLMPFLDNRVQVILVAGRPSDVMHVNVDVIFSSTVTSFSKTFLIFTYLIGTEK